MMEDLHERARRLIAAKGVEGISTNHQAWLDAHLEGCSACAEMAEAVERAIRTLRSVTVQVNTELVDRTRRVVQLRAHELRGRQAQLIPIWMSCALYWFSCSGGLCPRWRRPHFLPPRDLKCQVTGDSRPSPPIERGMKNGIREARSMVCPK
jgi:hypothetical protein